MSTNQMKVIVQKFYSHPLFEHETLRDENVDVRECRWLEVINLIQLAKFINLNKKKLKKLVQISQG